MSSHDMVVEHCYPRGSRTPPEYNGFCPVCGWRSRPYRRIESANAACIDHAERSRMCDVVAVPLLF